MNAYGPVILATLLVRFGLEVAADLLNVRALGHGAPPALRPLYDALRWGRMRAYVVARTRLGLAADTTELVALLAFWRAGGFGGLDRSLRALGLPGVATGVLYVGLLGLGATVVGLPFRWWSTFVVEERFGFNRTTARTFVTDLAKGALLAVLLGGPLLAAVLWLLARAGPTAWLWCWLATGAVVVVLQAVVPTYILPLFHRFTALPEGPARARILAYARTVGFPLEDVCVIDGSRRSTKANALFAGVGRHRRVALFDTLLDTLDADEVVAVVAHEVGHYRRRHVLQATVLAIAHLGFVFFLVATFLRAPGLYAAFGVDAPSPHAGLVLVMLLLAPVELAVSIVLHALARRNEREADAFAVATTGSGEALARALERLAAHSLAPPALHRLDVVLHHTHPPLVERLRALRRPPDASPSAP